MTVKTERDSIYLLLIGSPNLLIHQNYMEWIQSPISQLPKHFPHQCIYLQLITPYFKQTSTTDRHQLILILQFTTHQGTPKHLFATLAQFNKRIEGLRERNEYVPQLWNWENHTLKPVTRQKTCTRDIYIIYNELFGFPPEIVMHDAFNVILWMSTDICVVVHDDLGWKNWTTRYNCGFSVTSLALQVIFSGRTTKQHVIIAGFGQLAAVRRRRHTLSILTK